MKTKVKKLSDSRIELTVTLDSEDFKKAAKQALEKLAKEVKVEGFRQGKAPVDVAKRFIPENDLNQEALDIAVRTTVVPAFQESQNSPLVVPNVNVTKFVPGEVIEYTATADIVPEIKLGDFKKLGVKREIAKVAEKDIEGVLNNIANSFADKKATKKKVVEGDEVIIDFVGKKDGKAFEGGTAKDYALVIGSKMFIPGFEDGIVGHEPGDKFEIELTFPKDYGVKELAGEKVIFEVLLKQVNEVKKPEIDDELAKKCGPFKNLAELKKDIEKNMSAQTQAKMDEKFKNDLVDALVKKSKIPMPETLVEDQIRSIREDTMRNAESRGMGFDEFLEATGQNLEEWEKMARLLAETRIQGTLALQTLATEQNIEIPEKEVDKKLAELREVYKKSPEALKNLKEPSVKAEIRNRLMIDKTLDFLVKANEK